MTITEPILHTAIPGLPRTQGKVRDISDLGDQLLLVTTDRISAVDVVMPNGIPDKGKVLTQISEFWFERFSDVKNHLIEVIRDRVPAGLEENLPELAGRSMLCEKCEVLPVECVVRGYLTGSGWKDYLKTGQVCGVQLPGGLKQCQQLDEPIFTPATKATRGHDENISFEQASEIVGKDVLAEARDRSIHIYREGAAYARERGVVIADTKFEWGAVNGSTILIDEVLTPDSSRFWPADKYQPGRDQESFDKQFVRNFLESIKFDKSGPGVELPDDIVAKTSDKYIEAYERLTGKTFQP